MGISVSIDRELELQREIKRLHDSLQKIVGVCLAPDRDGNGMSKIHAVACKALADQYQN